MYNVGSDANSSPFGGAASTNEAGVGDCAGVTAASLNNLRDESPSSGSNKRPRDDKKPVFTCKFCSHDPFHKKGNLDNHLKNMHRGRGGHGKVSCLFVFIHLGLKIVLLYYMGCDRVDTSGHR